MLKTDIFRERGFMAKAIQISPIRVSKPNIWNFFKVGLIIPFMLSISFFSIAQSPFQVIGEVKDFASSQPISFVNIKIGNTHFGTVTNEWGQFLLTIPPEHVNDSLYISSIGYKTEKVGIKSLEAKKFILIQLSPNPYSLSAIEFEVKKGKSLSARQIVKKATRQIPDLYPETPYQLTGYYRDYLKKDSVYLNLFESALEMYDPGFRKPFLKSVKINLLSSQYNQDFEVIQQVPKSYDNTQAKFIPNYFVTNYGGNELSLLMVSDPVRNYKIRTFSHVYCIKDEFHQNHTFTLDSILLLNNEPVFKISMRLKDPEENVYLKYFAPNAYVEGEIYIHAEDFSILEFSYINFVSPSDLTKVYEIRLAYQSYDGKMYLSYISMNNVFLFQGNDTTTSTTSDGKVILAPEKNQQLYQFREFFVSTIDPWPSSPIVSNISMYSPIPLLNPDGDFFSREEFNALMSRPLKR